MVEPHGTAPILDSTCSQGNPARRQSWNDQTRVKQGGRPGDQRGRSKKALHRLAGHDMTCAGAGISKVRDGSINEVISHEQDASERP
jgi:hypothetical protein